MFQNKILSAIVVTLFSVGGNANPGDWDSDELQRMLNQRVDIDSVDWSGTPEASSEDDPNGAAAVTPRATLAAPAYQPETEAQRLYLMVSEHQARYRAAPNDIETLNSYSRLHAELRAFGRNAIGTLNNEDMEIAASAWARLRRPGNARRLRADFVQALLRQHQRAPAAIMPAGY